MVNLQVFAVINLYKIVLATECRGMRLQADSGGDFAFAIAIIKVRGKDQRLHAAFPVVVARLQERGGFARIHGRVIEVKVWPYPILTCAKSRVHARAFAANAAPTA